MRTSGLYYRSTDYHFLKMLGKGHILGFQLILGIFSHIQQNVLAAGTKSQPKLIYGDFMQNLKVYTH